MAASMMESILEYVTPEIKQALATRLGASQQTVTTGMGTATAALLGGLASKAGDSNFLSQILSMVSSGGGANILGSLGSLAAGGTSGGIGDLVSKFLPMVFGGQQSTVTNVIAQKAGVNAASAGSLLSMAVPLVLGYLGKLQSSGSLNLASLGSMLKAEAPNLGSYLPSGFMSSLTGTASSATEAVGKAASDLGSGPGVGKTAGWLVGAGIVGAILMAWLVYNALDSSKTNVKPVATEVVNAPANAANAMWAALGDYFKYKLPDGTELNIPQLGVEKRLIAFIEDGSQGVDKETWFDFDRLLFDTGKATLQPASDQQLHDIAAILKAYPKVKVRIGGYTDNTGDKTANLKLSEDRAQNVMAELVKLGVDPSRITAKGYGEEHPVADNTTEEGRQKNRRISLRVTEK